MPSPLHKCAYIDCVKMVNSRATYCRSHFPRTPEHIERQAATLRNRHPSLETRKKISEKKYSRIEVVCKQCEKTFYVKKGIHNKNNHGLFCSNTCHYTASSGNNSPLWKGGLSLYHCNQCGKEVGRYSSQTTNRQRTFCSIPCKAIYYKAHQKTSGTKIEQIMKQALNTTKYQFTEQVPLCNTTIADFYNHELAIAIFCDGDYWHRLPNRAERDARQNTILQENNITVLRFWETDIKHNINYCLDQIHYAIEQLVCQFQPPNDKV